METEIKGETQKEAQQKITPKSEQKSESKAEQLKVLVEEEKKESIWMRLDLWMHCLMALVGGFMGAYAIFNRFDIFGSAVTGNLIHLVMDLEDAKMLSVLIRLGSVVVFALAVAIATLIPARTSWNVRKICLYIEIPVCILLAFFPADMNGMLSLYPVFFIMAFQWTSFTGACGYVCSTIFSTNNLKQTVSSFCLYWNSGDPKYKEKGTIFGLTLLAFHTGIAISYATSKMLGLGLKSSLLCVIPLAIVYVLVEKQS